MSDTQIQTQPAGTAIAKKPPTKVFAEFLEARREQLAAIVPNTLTLERVMKVALAAYGRTPKLQECTIQSVYQSIHQSVQLGLEPGGPLGHAYLVPYKDTCTLIVGYKGLIALARRSGEIVSIEARIVRQGDEFRLSYGIERELKHVPSMTAAGPVLGCYAIAHLKGGGFAYDWMPKAEIEAIRNGSRAANNGPWVTHWEEMARKTAIRRLCKYLPMSVELAEAVEAESEREPIDVTPPRATEKPDAAARVLSVVADEPEPPHDPVTGEVLDEKPADAKPVEPTVEPKKRRASGASDPQGTKLLIEKFDRVEGPSDLEDAKAAFAAARKRMSDEEIAQVEAAQAKAGG